MSYQLIKTLDRKNNESNVFIVAICGHTLKVSDSGAEQFTERYFDTLHHHNYTKTIMFQKVVVSYVR
jgi:hypothetical protein